MGTFFAFFVKPLILFMICFFEWKTTSHDSFVLISFKFSSTIPIFSIPGGGSNYSDVCSKSKDWWPGNHCMRKCSKWAEIWLDLHLNYQDLPCTTDDTGIATHIQSEHKTVIQYALNPNTNNNTIYSMLDPAETMDEVLQERLREGGRDR